MAFSRTKFVNLLRSQVGYHEGRDPSGNWNNKQRFSPETPGLEWSQNQAWCATFTAWGADEMGARDRWPITASCATAVSWWKQRGRWTEYPVLGGPFYLGTVGQDHVGVVYAYDADTIWTVEGNTNASGSAQGDGVYLRTRPRRGANSPYGYGVPQFDEGTVSADPALGGTAKASVPTQAPTAPPKEDDVALSADDVKKIAAATADAVWAKALVSPTAPPGTNPLRAAGTFLRWGDQHTAEILARIAALSAAVAKLAEAGGLDATEVQAAAEAGARAALVELGDRLTD